MSKIGLRRTQEGRKSLGWDRIQGREILYKLVGSPLGTVAVAVGLLACTGKYLCGTPRRLLSLGDRRGQSTVRVSRSTSPSPC